MNTDSEPNKAEQLKRSCADCHTTRTPLWRGGPAGPGSLCNACGIRFRKQRSALLGLGKGGGEKNKKKMKRRRNGEIVSLKLRFMGLGRDIVLQKRKLGEEEEAAILLMALSSGSVYA